ncbi:MAG: hypothetical protein HN995_05215 [Candidatus Marinimicrobia bacterium]|nr:hypothetical protein [Candidatus Neomarinimicrobiota bacterium]MBT3575706.1 hypothetical protein [Candidatus Neomarinimicrobiota bacterium]MBT3679142.1 hypothetical protein [Candidatus Neomarinimicrobiota bacterium]MBT3949779.1 hypothetical protein [Candidatus Neomarinimicrobiota bacterium]MBT4251994.1 hypothetical protein [Candidatus Neomarinimicrobiota bacterium]
MFEIKKPCLIFLFLLVSFTSLLAQSRERTEHWHNRNQQFNAEMDSIGHVDIVFLGNSITEGFDLDHYFPEHRVANRGIIADHMDGIMERLQNSALRLKPRKLFLMIGINDIGDRRNDEYLKTMFVTLVDTLVTSLPETDIYLLSILPTTARWKNCPPGQIKRINGFLTRLALEKDLGFINLYPHFLGDMQYMNPDLTQDGLHPNQAGYDVMAKKIKPFLSANN